MSVRAKQPDGDGPIRDERLDDATCNTYLSRTWCCFSSF